MRVIIAGSRSVTSYAVVEAAIARSGFTISEVVSGTARGVDRLGELWAARNGVPVKKFPADWDTYGKRAGYLRNKEMAEYAEALVAIHDGESRGTQHMIDTARETGLKVSVTTAEVEG
jgi:hypothetical protein